MKQLKCEVFSINLPFEQTKQILQIIVKQERLSMRKIEECPNLCCMREKKMLHETFARV